MLFFPIAGLIYFSAAGIGEKYTEAKAMAGLQSLSALAVKASNLVHELQKERGSTSVFIGSKGTEFASELSEYRTGTDKKISDLQTFLNTFQKDRYGVEFKKSLEAATASLEEIKTKRAAASALTVSADETIGYYSKMIAQFLGLISHMTRISTDADITILTEGYANFLLAKERAGIERATLSNTFARDAFGPGMFKRFASAVISQETYLNVFLSVATAEQKDFYKNKMQGQVIDETEKMRGIAFDNTAAGKFGIEAPYWFKMQTAKINLLKEVEDKLSDDLIAAAEGHKSSDEKTLAQYVILTIITVVIAIILAYVVIRSITRPIGQATGMLKQIAEGSGDLTQRMRIASHDEVGMLGMWFNKFVEGMQDMVKGIFAASGQVSSASQTIKHSSENIHSSAETQFQAVDETSSSIEEMDASIRTVAGDAEKLLKSTDEASASSLEMFASTTEVAENSEKLALSVDRTVASINEIAATLKQVAAHVDTLFTETEGVVSGATELNSTIKEISVHAREQAIMAEKVKEDAMTVGRGAVNKTREGMEKIKGNVSDTSIVIDKLRDKSSEIGNIIGVINEIADTTNLLALNAFILAAQAGEHGKGFAVIADEVKALAERTTSKTKEIAVLVGEVQDGVSAAVNSMGLSSAKVEEGVQLARDADEALKKIIERTESSLQMALKIERATEEQTKGVGLVAEAIKKVNNMVEEIKKATDEQRKASEEILHATEDMKDITRNVKHSTQEQSKEGKYISEVITDIAQKMQDIAKATAEQRKASQNIVMAIETIKREIEKNVSLASQLDVSVDSMDKQAASLKNKVYTFKV
ncbi:MAG: nitrate- and nitrite sensing domain-containing protein [Deltaproteobacteria bacterium]|nr:nitrate- and nitrite sensing domain-containing protein [Deltaproteobacteria bacterium]